MGDGEEGSSEPSEPPLDPPLIALSVYVPYNYQLEVYFTAKAQRSGVGVGIEWLVVPDSPQL